MGTGTTGSRFKYRYVSCVAMCAVLSLTTGCGARSPVTKSNGRDYWPTQGWRTSSPEMQGMDSDRLSDALEYIRKKELAVHSLLVVRHGYMVLDAYFFPYSSGIPHDVASVTKSVTSSLIGLAVDKGYIRDLGMPVLEFFPGVTPANSGPAKERVAIGNLLTMTSGLDCGAPPREETLVAMRASADWAQFALNLPMADEPGTRFTYCSPNTHLLSAILTRTTGLSAREFAIRFLFGPLGIRDPFWPSDPQGITRGWGDLRMHPRDMARFGYLFLNRGEWENRRILSHDWVRRSTRRQVSVPGGEADYGYGWWVFSRDFPGLCEARGRGGQYISVWPEKDIVVVMTGGHYDRGVLGPILVSALKSDRALPENPDGWARLQATAREVSLPPDPIPVPPLPETAGRISGKVYRLDPNPLGVKSVSLRFGERGDARFTVSLSASSYSESEGRFDLPVGLDGVYRVSGAGPSGVPVALKGRWKTDNEFLLHYNEVARNASLLISMTFDGDRVESRIVEGTGLFEERVRGRTVGE